ncbi:MAG TPA: Lrp/AsnC family transcriptional regulator [Ktedonobacterales bacterium]|nr:Lrp/AsnC family transcriptional regulator [Ktedonobacterales bacterium]
MDEIDRDIVRVLHANGRLSQEQLAREVHLSRPAVHERIKRLEEEGIIRGYRALLDWSALGYQLTAFAQVKTMRASREAGKAMMQIQNPAAFVEECHRVAGEWCLMVKIRAASPRDLEVLLDQMYEIPGVQSTMTTTVLSTLGEDGALEEDWRAPSERSALSSEREAS